jgi:hypothetical protein
MNPAALQPFNALTASVLLSICVSAKKLIQSDDVRLRVPEDGNAYIV